MIFWIINLIIRIIVEIELYKKYLISFKSKISLYNKKVRVMYSKKWADKYINYVDLELDVKDKAYDKHK